MKLPKVYNYNDNIKRITVNIEFNLDYSCIISCISEEFEAYHTESLDEFLDDLTPQKLIKYLKRNLKEKGEETFYNWDKEIANDPRFNELIDKCFPGLREN